MANMKFRRVLWDVASCSLRGADCTSETSVSFETTQCYIPEDSELHNLMSFAYGDISA
jgi:hypothetical protein